MDKKYLVFAALETVVVTLPLGLVLFFVIPAPDEGLSYLIWACFSTALAGVVPLLLRAFRLRISRDDVELSDARMSRLASVAFMVSFSVLLPIWFSVFVTSPELGPWTRIAVVPLVAVVLILCVRFIGLPSYWRRYRRHAVEAGLEFTGSEMDLMMRPEYYDEDIRWVLTGIRKRLTSASSRRGKR